MNDTAPMGRFDRIRQKAMTRLTLFVEDAVDSATVTMESSFNKWLDQADILLDSCGTTCGLEPMETTPRTQCSLSFESADEQEQEQEQEETTAYARTQYSPRYVSAEKRVGDNRKDLEDIIYFYEESLELKKSDSLLSRKTPTFTSKDSGKGSSRRRRDYPDVVPSQSSSSLFSNSSSIEEIPKVNTPKSIGINSTASTKLISHRRSDESKSKSNNNNVKVVVEDAMLKEFELELSRTPLTKKRDYVQRVPTESTGSMSNSSSDESSDDSFARSSSLPKNRSQQRTRRSLRRVRNGVIVSPSVDSMTVDIAFQQEI